MSFELYEMNSFDIEGDFLEQKQKPTTFFKYQTTDPKNLKKIDLNEKNSPCYVKIPVVNPMSESLFDALTLKCYFYFKSYKSQEFWNKRGTKIYITK